MTDIHATRLIEWAVHQFGKALMFAALAALVIGVWIGATGGSAAATIGLANLAGFITFALTLWSVRAPLPLTDEQIDRLVGEDVTSE